MQFDVEIKGCHMTFDYTRVPSFALLHLVIRAVGHRTFSDQNVKMTDKVPVLAIKLQD